MKLVIAAIAAMAAPLAYLRLARGHVLNFGATREEASAPLPGDEILSEVAIQTTRAITVNARPSDIWPWLVQIGPKPRAGVYTYDWIERMLGIDIANSDRILPEFQQMEVGEFFALDKSGSNGLVVRRVEVERALVFQWRPANSTWAFVLSSENGETRLLSRNRIPGNGLRFWLGMVALMEPGSLVMERRMLNGIKQRAERTLHANEPFAT